MAHVLRIGIIGAGSVAQIVHLPILSLMPHLYKVTVVCDVSKKNAEHCAAKFHIPVATTDPQDVISSTDVDLVFILTTDDCHEPLAIAALTVGKKDVFLEKPITLSLPSAQRIADAEKAAGGKRVFVGYMRRYAPSFTQAFKREVASIPRILYARVRDFSGQNDFFTAQAGAFQVANADVPQDAKDEAARRLQALFDEAFGGSSTEEQQQLCFFMNRLGSHDISLMRETLGMPESVTGVTANEPFYTATFNMRDGTGAPYAVTYESGIDDVPVFDAHLTVYGEKKRVTIEYDTPFVKGLPINVKVEESNEHGEVTCRNILSSYEDAYTAELRVLHACFTEGKKIKTTVADAMQDLMIYDMMYREHARTQAQRR